MPKRGSLKSAGERQESATFLQRSLFDVALQFFACCSAAFGQNHFRNAENRMLQCNVCSAAFRKLQRNFCFSVVACCRVGFRGVGFRTCWEMTIKTIFERSSQKGGPAGASKRGSTGDPPWNFIVGLKHRKNNVLESRIFIVVASSHQGALKGTNLRKGTNRAQTQIFADFRWFLQILAFS